ncbi:hypothetical protein NQ176_g5733 [Zarea fungicola]|uniref:Uncharacterized protein n=1 Tax=Zarea fungicola TaxID=93591 RepID=A0ACC1N6Z5_9HYPO|nr:hypothetical protein NQ176_g5733 [Lecanicillium fungicola]
MGASARTAIKILARVLDTQPDTIDRASSFVKCGGDSIAALRFCTACKLQGVDISADDVLSSATISELLQRCRQGAGRIESAGAMDMTQRKDDSDRSVETRSPSGTISESEASFPDSLSTISDSPFSISSATKLEDSLHADDSVLLDGQTHNLIGQSFHECKNAQNDELLMATLETEDLCDPILAAKCTPCEFSTVQIPMVQGGSRLPGSNIIHYYEEYHPSQIVAAKEAWKLVLSNESIFRTVYRDPHTGCNLLPRLHWREFTTTSARAYDEATTMSGSYGRGKGKPELVVPSWEGLCDTSASMAVRFTVIHLETAADVPARRRSTLIWSIHHALIDGWSAALVLRKVKAAMEGDTVQPGPSYSSLCLSLEEMRMLRKAEGDAFWASMQRKLLDGRDDLLFPAPEPSEDDHNQRGTAEEVRFSLRRHQTEELRQVAQSCGVTYATLLHAAWAICLSLCTDSDNVIIGTVMSGRHLPLPGVLETVGPTVTTLPLQVDICWEMSLAEFFDDVYHRMKLLSQFSWTTMANGCPPVAGHMFAMQPDVQEHADGDNLRPSFTRQMSDLPLSIIASDNGNITIQYHSQRFYSHHMKTLSRMFQRALAGICQTDKTLQRLAATVMSTKSLATLRSMGNCNSSATTRASITDDLVTLFERVTRTHPSAIAVEQADETVTYSELLERSGFVAQALLDLGVKPEEVVAVHADGSINWIVSIYGVLRAGAVYCPLDEAHPQDYRDSLFDSSGARFFLTTSSNCPSSIPKLAVSVLSVDSVVEKVCEAASEHALDTMQTFPLRTRPRPWDRAYLIFTSGSTGKPKGVICSHQSLVAFQLDTSVRLKATVGVRVAQVMSVAFDGSIHELFSALSYGATLVLKLKRETFGHLKTVDSAILTPSVASVLHPGDFPRLKTLYLVGEPVPQRVCDTWGAEKTVYNMYGPTEATCGATIKLLSPGKPVTIGGPNPTTRIYVLDHRQRLAPPGRVGEIYLAGVQVSQGYLNRPELNAECFLPDPFCSGLGEFMYKTGDRGYWSKDGEICFLGRSDREMKLRGYRIHLDSLESQIALACKSTGALAVAVTRLDDELVCIMQTDNTYTSAVIQKTIRKAIPSFAVPRHMFITNEIPTTPTGKIDYKAVIGLARRWIEEEEAEKTLKETGSAMTETEAMVVAIWEDILENSDSSGALGIGPHSSLIQLGGHSLHHVRLASRLSAATRKPVPLRMLLDLPVLRDLAAKIDEIDVAPKFMEQEKIHDALTDDTSWARLSDPSTLEQQWWHRYRHGSAGTSSFTVSYVGKYGTQKVDRGRLVDAWNTVLKRHEVFRRRYLPVPHSAPGVQRLVLPCEYSPRVEVVKTVNVRDELNRPFRLFDEPVRVFISDEMVVALWSHIICDYTTLRLVLREVAAAYDNKPLGPVISLTDQVDGDASTDLSDISRSNLPFWSDCLGQVKDDRPAYLGSSSQRTSYVGKSLSATVSPSLWHRIQSQCSLQDITLQQVMVAAVAAAVSTHDQLTEEGITLGVPFINRQTEADTCAVGLKLEPLPIRVPFVDSTASEATSAEGGCSHASLRSYLSAVQDACRNSLYHAVPWHQLLEHLGVDPQEKLPDHPLFDCLVSFHDARPGLASTLSNSSSVSEDGPWSVSPIGEGPGIEPQLVWGEGSKFRLMIEFIAVDDNTLVLRFEYDTACFEGAFGGTGRIESVRRAILYAVDALVSRDVDATGSFDDLRRDLDRLWREETRAGFWTAVMAGGNDLDAVLLKHRNLALQTSLLDLATQ